MKEEVLRYIEEHPKAKRTLKDIANHLHLEEADVSEVLYELQEENLVFINKDMQFDSREQAGIVEGRISINRAGMGFLDREGDESIRVDPGDQNTALHGDTVLVRCFPWQVYGRVVKILKRSRDHLIGTFEFNGRKMKFVPDDEKLQGKIFKILCEDNFVPLDGLKVKCSIEDYGIPFVIRIQEKIGFRDDPGVDIKSILLDHDIEGEFPAEVMKQVDRIPQVVTQEETEGRRNLTNEIIVTIDGDHSKDFDDAVGVQREGNGYLLKVSIADVSHYVTEDSPLDIEALKRGCSTYVTDRVVPMLPHELSNGICSLNPHVVRLTLTCEMHISESGEITDYSIYPSYIRSTERMTYANVNKILAGDEQLTREYEHLGDIFFVLKDCANAIRKHREAKGAISFDSTESEIMLDKKGHPYDIVKRERGEAEEIIEDCMIAANVSVANFMKWQDIPSVYRIHEQPQMKRLIEFVSASEAMGHKLVLPKGDVHPNQIQRYLDSVKDEEEYPVLSMLLLRCMQKAKYDNQCIGHFGLAEEEYLHFTSPIRRYPDLIVHRMLRKYSFEACTDVDQRIADEEKTAEYALQSSVRERISQDAEYACTDMKKAEYMEDHVGLVAEGIITGVQSYGFYVELDNTIEGLVRIASLQDDYYRYDAQRMQLRGSSHKNVYTVGMKVKVICVGASKDNGTVDFEVFRKNGHRVRPAFRNAEDRRPVRRRKKKTESKKNHGRKKSQRKNSRI